MSVRKRTWTTSKGEKKEAWIVDYTDQEGDRHIETFERKKEADEYHDTVRVDVRHGVHSAPSKSETVAQAAENWIRLVEANGMKAHGPAERTTIRQYRQHVNLHIAPLIGRLKLSQLNPKVVEKFRDDLLEKLNRPTARKVLTSFKSLLKVAKRGNLAADVSIGVDKRSKHNLEPGRDFPTPAEVKRLIDAARTARDAAKGESAKNAQKRHALLLTAALTGLRASELRGLRWSDLEPLKDAELHVRQRADRYSKIGVPKTVSSRRTIPVAPELLTALREWKLACPKGEANLVFPTSTGQVEHHANMLRSLASIMIAAGVVDKKGKPKYALHAFRHFFASWCVNPKSRGGRELPAKEAQDLLGHSSIVMTLDLYGHMFPPAGNRDELAASASALLA